jgi:unsaturated chondroitin disaccharide hydrolase
MHNCSLMLVNRLERCSYSGNSLEMELMKQRLLRMIVACSVTIALMSQTAISQNLDSLARQAVAYSKAQLAKSVRLYSDSLRYPRSAGGDSLWKTVEPRDWTSGFFPGCLWIINELTQEKSFRVAAEKWTAGLEDQKVNARTHDVGFMIFSSFGNGNRLYPREGYGQTILQAAKSLSSRFNSRVGCIKSWDNRKWPYPVIIDNMMNLELLFWASKNGGSKELYDIAVSHALKTMQNHVRADGSTYHVVSYDTTTGAVLARETHQGYTNESVWARGQAWALYGFTMTYRETKDERFLKTAQRVADYFIDLLPADKVPYWDFQAPNIPNEERDVSAAAIACSGLFELSALSREPEKGAAYRKAAEHILVSLCQPPYLSRGTSSIAILNHAVGNKPGKSEIDVSLIYGDYYFLEAIKRYQQIHKN